MRLLTDPGPLTVEEPVVLSFRVTNLSPSAARLKLYVREEEARTMAINSFSPKVPFEEMKRIGGDADKAVRELRPAGTHISEAQRTAATPRGSCSGFGRERGHQSGGARRVLC